MIHKIKMLHDNGNGLSMRQIRDELGISKNTVKKYLRMDEESICNYLKNKERDKKLDKYKEWILHLLQKFPKLTAVKIKRKMKEKFPEFEMSDRSFRRYVGRLKSENPVKQVRYYEPVIDMVPGVQCQVDPGELRNVMIDGKPVSVYFVVFVLSYSRLIYVATSFTPINTEIFIRMHDEAFRYFGGVPEECVYDQTKLVVIHEEFREVQYNAAFYQYATSVGYDLRICEGYDPESKGKVEAGVKYVKNDFFYGEEFTSRSDLNQSLSSWIDNVANCRTHGTTQQVPVAVFEELERQALKAYLKPTLANKNVSGETRTVDKTSLISWKCNKYSVPQIYQSGSVLVNSRENTLFIYDIASGRQIATHKICMEKGQIVKNNNHYRDYQKKITDHENDIYAILGEEIGVPICSIIKQTMPKIYKDQLVGLKAILNRQQDQVAVIQALSGLTDRPRLKVSFIRDYLDGHLLAPEHEKTQVKGDMHHNANADLAGYGDIRATNREGMEDDCHAII
ncbi:MAG: IS21 family transposase [Desulfamplus sp.]|nr:IS21 family transposase [Desulfamplus sp.]